MGDLWFNILIEMGLLVFLGFLYYLYQRKKILNEEAHKVPLVMSYVLQCCLTDRGDDASPELDPLIEALDDYLQNKTAQPPLILIKNFVSQGKGSSELRDVMNEALKEIEGHGQK